MGAGSRSSLSFSLAPSTYLCLMRTIQLSHYYSKLRGVRFYAIRTNMSLEDVNLACGYLQLLRDQLPIFQTVEDDLGEVEGVELLSSLYGCEPIIINLRPSAKISQALVRRYSRDTITTRKRVRVDGVIDFYENWNDYAVHDDKRIRMNEFAQIGAKIAILNLMLKDARRNSTNASATKGTNIVERIEAIRGGALVTAEWRLKTLTGGPYVGTIFLGSEPDLV